MSADQRPYYYARALDMVRYSDSLVEPPSHQSALLEGLIYALLDVSDALRGVNVPDFDPDAKGSSL